MKTSIKKILFLAAVLFAAAGMIFTGCESESADPIGPKPPAVAEGTVTSVSVAPSVLNLIVGDEPVKLTAVVNGENLNEAGKAVTWKSQDTNVVDVASDGTVTVKGKGSTRVVATSVKDSSKSNHCVVNVDEADNKTVYSFDYSTLGSFENGTTALYNASKKYYNDAVYAYYNASSGSALRIRTSGGVNTALNYNGENTTTKDAAVGGTVAEGSYYVGIDLSKLTLTSETVKVEVTVTPNGSDKATDDSGIVYLVNETTGKVVAVETGVKIKSGGESRTITVEVSKTSDVRIFFSRNGNNGGGIDITAIKVIDENAGGAIVRPSSISLDKTTASLAITDSALAPSVTLTATISPSNITSGYGTVTWISDNTSVATVANGVVTAKGAGSATITASTSNGKTASCAVTVTSSVTTKYLLKTDTPVGYANIDLSKMTKTVKVSTKADLKKYLTAGGYIIYVSGKIDMSDGMMPSTAGGSTTALDNFVKSKSGGEYTTYKAFIDAYTGSCDTKLEDHGDNPKKISWSACKVEGDTKTTLMNQLWYLNTQYGNEIRVNPASNTLVIGIADAEIYGGCFSISSVNNVAFRNVTIRDAYDPFPHHEISGSSSDGFNAQHDCIVIQGSSYNIWVDHCTLKDTLGVGKAANGEKFQTYDGLCDMKNDTYNLTVSYTRFENHDKTMLIGSSDSDGSNETRTITLHHNYYLNCGQRLPMVRNTKLHNFNNYYDSNSSKTYSNSYCVGNRKGLLAVSENNYFGTGVQYSYKDNYGSVYKSGDVDKSSSGCNTSGSALVSAKPFTPTYTYTLDSASSLNTYIPKNSGAGVWTVPESEYSGL